MTLGRRRGIRRLAAVGWLTGRRRSITLAVARLLAGWRSVRRLRLALAVRCVLLGLSCTRRRVRLDSGGLIGRGLGVALVRRGATCRLRLWRLVRARRLRLVCRGWCLAAVSATLPAVSATLPAVGVAIVLPLRAVRLAAAAAEQARDTAHDLTSETATPWGRSVALTLLRTAVVVL